MMKSLILLVCLAVAIHGQRQEDDLFARLFQDNANAYQGGQNEGNFERLNFEADGSVRFPTNFGQQAQAEEQRFSPNIQYAANDDNSGQRYSPRFSQQVQHPQQDTQNFAPSTNFDQLRPFHFSNY